MPITEQKQDLRRQVQAQLRQFSVGEVARLSAHILHQVEQQPAFRQAATVLLYAPLPDEPQLQALLRRWSAEKRLLLPVVRGSELLVGDCGLLRQGAFGIMEPAQALPEAPRVDVAIVPGVAFDRSNHRLGRGKGYYDRFLSATPTYKLGVCFACQLLEHIPHDLHDVRMDAVLWG
jgi:5-formyltetrahydrofolate cyclo-ligase